MDDEPIEKNDSRLMGGCPGERRLPSGMILSRWI
jgi:hypothetical protein